MNKTKYFFRYIWRRYTPGAKHSWNPFKNRIGLRTAYDLAKLK